MNWADQLADVNLIAVLLATVSSFAVGAVWYSWGMFGKKWAKLEGLKKTDLESSQGMTKTYVKTGLGSLIAASTLYMLMESTNTEGVIEGLIFGFILGTAFRFTAHVMHDSFARRSDELTRINGFYDILQLMVMGAILGLFI